MVRSRRNRVFRAVRGPPGFRSHFGSRGIRARRQTCRAPRRCSGACLGVSTRVCVEGGYLKGPRAVSCETFALPDAKPDATGNDRKNSSRP